MMQSTRERLGFSRAGLYNTTGGVAAAFAATDVCVALLWAD